jgi:hypothetical protein
MLVVTVLVARAAGALVDPGFGRDLVTVVAGVAAGAATYLAAARLLRIQEIGLLLEIVRRRGRRAAPGGPGGASVAPR